MLLLDALKEIRFRYFQPPAINKEMFGRGRYLELAYLEK